MSPDPDPDPTEVEEEGTEEGEAAEQSEASRRGRKRRRDLADFVEEDTELHGQIDAMVSHDSFHHRLVLRGRGLTEEGGPANEVFSLGAQAARALKALFPGIDPQVAQVAAGNSITIDFYAPDPEVQAALKRRSAEDDIGAEGLPDTTLAVLAFAEVISQPDPAAAGDALRAVSVTAADRVRDLGVTLAQSGVALDLSEVKATAQAEPRWATELVEHLDATEEIPAETVTVYGLLQGANSGGQGSFELVTEATRDLDPRLGRRKPGDKIHGTLTRRARKQIREQNLWDTHVVTRVQVTRVRRGRSIRQAGLRLMSVERLPSSG